jgi:hypothetical protein
MKYRVQWIQSALDDLMELWLLADSEIRKEITSAVNSLDRELQVDPHAFSESRDQGEWICFSEPLGLLIEIDETDSIVWVLAVWRFR